MRYRIGMWMMERGLALLPERDQDEFIRTVQLGVDVQIAEMNGRLEQWRG